VHILEKYYLKGRAPWVSNEQLKKMAKEVNAKQRTFVGDVAPELQLYDLEHKMHSLHNQMNEYTILFFYDPDCGHCKDAAPKIAKLHKKYKDMGVGLFAVCIKNDTAKMRDFIEKYNLNGVNVADLTLQSNMRKKYDLRSTPVKFILNYDKEIVTKQLGARQMDQFLARKLDVEPGGVVPDKKKKQQKEDQAQNPDHSSNGTPTPNRASTR
jgi:thiol-disulfide isomerase/thioredoxin